MVTPLLVGLSAAAGAVGGALLPLAAYRHSVPVDVQVRGACFSCARPLPPGLAGWVRLPARCAGCGMRLGPNAWLTAGSAALASGLLATALGSVAALPIFIAAAILAVLLATIDVACKRLPHRLVVPAIWISAALFAAVAAVTGEWDAWLRSVIAGGVLGAAFLVLYLLPGQGLGYGDVKLAVLVGLYLGWLGWSAVLLGALFAWLVNGPVVLALLLLRRVHRKSSLPFGPAMLTGGLLAAICATWFEVVPWR